MTKKALMSLQSKGEINMHKFSYNPAKCVIIKPVGTQNWV